MRTLRIGLIQWVKIKIVDPFFQIVRRGAEPKQLAFSAALGITLGVFPICGVTVFLCGMAIALLGSVCHAPTLMLANFVATPIELSLVVPFLRFGEIVTGGPHFPLTTDALRKVVTGEASRDVFISIYHAGSWWLSNFLLLFDFITFHLGFFMAFFFNKAPASIAAQVIKSFIELLGWFVAAPVILAVLYVLFFPFFKYLIRKFSVPSAPSAPLYSLSEISAKARVV